MTGAWSVWAPGGKRLWHNEEIRCFGGEIGEVGHLKILHLSGIRADCGCLVTASEKLFP